MNYYGLFNFCPHCQRSETKLHLGKSSGAYNFAHCGYGNKGCHEFLNNEEVVVRDIEAWKALVRKADRVVDEYGGNVDDEMGREKFIEWACAMTGKKRHGDIMIQFNGISFRHEYPVIEDGPHDICMYQFS
jgi:hypothetical protein